MKPFIAYKIQFERFFDHLYRKLFGLPQLKRSEITPYLFLGGQYHTPGIPKLKKIGITAIVSMREFAVPSEKAKKVFNILHLPTPDQHAPAIDDLKRGIEFMHREINNGGKVYVHCRLGEGRGPTMAIAYLISIGIPLEEAVNQVKKVRTFINITPPQYKQLKILGELLLSAPKVSPT